MKYKDCCDDLSNIEIQIKELQLQKKEYETAKKNVIENLTHEYSDNISKIDSILTELEKKENYFKTEREAKQKKIKNIVDNIALITKEIDKIKQKNKEFNDSKISQYNKEISQLKSKTEKINFCIKKYKSKQKREKLREMEKQENNNMLEEEFIYCKNMLIVLTSKIESHSEFVKTILKTKNILSNSLEKLNETIPDSYDISKDINVIQVDKLAENIFSYCNPYLLFTVSHKQFISDVTDLNSFEEVIDYSLNVSTNKLPHNLFEYLLIALCRIMSYENLLEMRMKVVNAINDSSILTLNNESKKEDSLTYKEKIKEKENELKKVNEEIKEKEEMLKETKRKKEENEKNINDMLKDVNAMITYKEKINDDITKQDKVLSEKQKNAVKKIEELKIKNKELNDIISYKKEKLLHKVKLLDEEISRICDIKEQLISHKESKLNKFNINIKNTNSTMETTSTNAEFKYPSTMSEKELLLTQMISSLFTPVIVFKRQIINVKKQIYENFNPVIRNKILCDPNDYGFKQYHLSLNKEITKLLFKKISPLQKTIDISPSSLSRIEIPIFTKSLIFLKKLISQLIKKFNLSTAAEIDKYFKSNEQSIMKLYKDGASQIFDTKILNSEYRDALLESKKYILYLYLKPDEDTKLELIFTSSREYKKWVNGLTQLISDPQYTKQVIDKYII